MLYLFADAAWLQLFEQQLYTLGTSFAPVLQTSGNYAFPAYYFNTISAPWLEAVQWFIFAFVIVHLLFVSRFLDNLQAIIISCFFFGILLAVASFILGEMQVWLRLALPINLLIYGQLLIFILHPLIHAATRYTPSPNREQENQYRLGQAFFDQGHLDWAHEKFSVCKPSRKLKNALTDLAEAYEHKGLSHKALAVYQEIIDRHMDDQNCQRRLFSLQSALHTQPVKIPPPEAEQARQAATPEMIIEHYKIETELGKGAMGRIYRAIDLDTNKQVAIKTLHLADEFDESELENVKQRFFREAQTAGQLKHPNIVTIHEAGETNNLAWIAMEFLSGHDLMRYTAADNLLPSVMIMGIAHKAARALHYAHENNVIHRDIKPANIMFDSERKQIKITDFGIARISDVNRTKTGIVLGTPSYMSPEQLAGSDIDGRSDLFALGVMLFHLLTGELPFKGESLAMLMYMIANEPHRDLSELRPDIAQTYPDLVAIIDKALEKNASDRFQTGNEMAKALKACAKK